MKPLLYLLLTSTLLYGCGAEDSANNATDNTGSDPTSGENVINASHTVCKFDEDGEALVANHSIDEAQAWLLIDSMSEAASDIDLNSLPNSDQFEGAFAITAFIAPAFADVFSSFNVLYACSEPLYLLNQCNWENDFQESGTLKVETVLGSGQSYTTQVPHQTPAFRLP